MTGRVIAVTGDGRMHECAAGGLRRLLPHEAIAIRHPRSPSVTVLQPVDQPAEFDAVHVAYATPDPQADRIAAEVIAERGEVLRRLAEGDGKAE